MINTESASILQRVKRLLGVGAQNEVLTLLRAAEDRWSTVEARLHDSLALMRVTEERSRTLEAQLHHSLALITATEERSRTLEAQLHDSLMLLRVTEERSRTFEAQMVDSLALQRATEERSRTLEAQSNDSLMLLRSTEERSRTLEAQLDESLLLLRATEERSRTLQAQLHDSLTLLHATDERSREFEGPLHDSLTLLRATEERSRSLQYQSAESLFAISYQLDMLQKWYVELAPGNPSLVNNAAIFGAQSIRLETAHPIALTSNDHIVPESTSEGIVRPTQFVNHCVFVLGQNIRCLDLGTGAAGLVFEFGMNGVVAIGVDGSDHCRKNKIGYWPLLPDNLHTCDITHPFRFKQIDGGSIVSFDLITMWEVLEHIGEKDLPSLLGNIEAHLESTGYFIGSISLLEYVGESGVIYHVTLKSKSWWQDKFQESGLIMLDDHPFNERLFCRGNGPRFQDFHNYFSNPEDGFHFVAQRIQPRQRQL